ncbi:MAG: serine hydrolase [bacterium]
MLRRISLTGVFLFATLWWLAVCLVEPANLSAPPGIEGPPLPPRPQMQHKAPRVYCRSAILIDNNTGHTLYTRNPYEVRPIASITKLLTILTWLDFEVDFDTTIEMIKADAYKSSKSRLRAGDIYRAKDLFYAAMMSSDNRAARALARSTGLTIEQFADSMNVKARELGLLTMHVIEPTGLSELNVASAADCAKLLNFAADNPTIKQAMRTRRYEFTSVKRKRSHVLGNTNRLLLSSWYVEGVKTVYIFESGWCVAVRVSDWHKHDLTAVVLGANSKSSRFTQASKLFKWAFRELREQKG